MPLYISNPDVSLPTVPFVLNVFGLISGYKLNLNKSEIFPLNVPARNYPLQTLPFRIVLNKFTYLGVHVTDKFDKLFKAHFTPLLTLLEKDFERWSLHHPIISWSNSFVKMKMLPKFSYLFLCIPFFIAYFFILSIPYCRWLWSLFLWTPYLTVGVDGVSGNGHHTLPGA